MTHPHHTYHHLPHPHHHARRKKKRRIIYAVISVVLVIIFWWYFKYHHRPLADLVEVPIINDFAPQDSAHQLADDIFVPKDSVETKSWDTTYPDGRLGSNWTYQILATPFSVDRVYLANLNNWIIDDQKELSKDHYLLIARNGQRTLLVDILGRVNNTRSQITLTVITRNP